jgi:hypothetical protein
MEANMATYMATTSTGLATPSSGAPQHKKGSGFVSQIGRVINSVARFFASLAAAQQAARRYEYLAHLSDAELSARGLKREDIPFYVAERMHKRRT